MKIAIIGAGALGTVMSKIMKENRRNSVALWDIVPGKVKKQQPLEKILPAADVVFLCMPSSVLRDAGAAIRPYLRRSSVVVGMSKGIEANTNFTLDRLLRKILPWRQHFALLFGPMLASEIFTGGCGHAVAASRSRTAQNRLVSVFAGTSLRVATSDDVRGVALCGALKNVYAIGMGVLKALGAGDNVRGAYISAAAGEMRQIVKTFGGRGRTVYGYAGLGDLVATGLSANSRNHQVGCALGTRTHCQESEGSRAALSFSELLGKRLRHLPILHALVRVLDFGADPEELIAAVCLS
jgi:glycerol-3-phosphate dehydrogenase (NAD(P)+)